MSDEVEDFLEHVGVKGMKWGVRRGKDGSRPIARALAAGPVGKVTRARLDAHYKSQSKKTAKKKAKASAARAAASAPKGEKTVSAGKQRDIEIKAARARLNEGRSLGVKLLNADSFGKPLGGRQMLELYNPKASQTDKDLAAKMTRGQKTALGLVAGATVAMALINRG